MVVNNTKLVVDDISIEYHVHIIIYKDFGFAFQIIM